MFGLFLLEGSVAANLENFKVPMYNEFLEEGGGSSSTIANMAIRNAIY